MEYSLDNLEKGEKDKILNLKRYVESLQAHCHELSEQSIQLENTIIEKNKKKSELENSMITIKKQLDDALAILNDSCAQKDKIQKKIIETDNHLKDDQKYLESLIIKKSSLEIKISKLQKLTQKEKSSNFQLPIKKSMSTNTETSFINMVPVSTQSFGTEEAPAFLYKNTKISSSEIQKTKEPLIEGDKEVDQIVFLLNHDFSSLMKKKIK